MTACQRFFKLSGAGNDFLALVEPDVAPSRDAIRHWCRRRLSIGADGLFFIERQEDRPQGVRMHHFNADGRRAELCLNGARCAARLAFELGWAADRLSLVTDVGVLDAERLARSSIRLQVPLSDRPQQLRIVVDDHEIDGWRVEVGVPHFVLLQDEVLEGAPVKELGSILRHHREFGERGTNVDFVHIVGFDRLDIRTYERGVEAETLACGTGVLAAAVVGLATKKTGLPLEATTRGGSCLRVEGTFDDHCRLLAWTLTGEARIVASGEIEPEAEAG